MLDSAKTIGAIDSEMGKRFLSLLQGQTTVNADFAAQVSTICENMLNSGWYGETTCGEYIQLCSGLKEQADLWLLIGEQCLVFSNNNRVTLECLRSLQTLFEKTKDKEQIVFTVTTMNYLLTGMKTQSPALLVDVIKTACEIFPQNQQPFLWVETAQQFSIENPNSYQRFLKLSRQLFPFNSSERALASGIDHWSWLISIREINVDVALEFMQAIPLFGVLLNDADMLTLLKIIAEDKAQALNLIKTIGEKWECDCLAEILSFAVKLAAIDINALQQLLYTAKEQSLNLAKLEPWLEQGLALTEEDVLTGQAWFSLESLKSKEFYRDIRGAVHMTDCNHLLSLLSEGLGGAALTLSAIESEKWCPDNFAENIQLPDEVALFESRDENFSLYRLMILYQVSFWESGVAGFLNQTDGNSAAKFISSIENPTLGLNLLNIILPMYVERFMVSRYKGIKEDLKRWQHYYLSNRSSLSNNNSLLNSSGEPEFTRLDYMLGYSLTRFGKLETTESSNKVAKSEQENSAISDTEYSVFETLLTDSVFKDFESLMAAVKSCYDNLNETLYLEKIEPVFYRGSITIDLALVSLKMESLKEEVDQVTGDDESHGLSDILDPSNVTVEELRQGDTENAMGQFLTDLEGKLTEGDIEDEDLKEKAKELRGKLFLEHGKKKKQAQIFTYNEWDYLIKDYRKDWCILHQILLPSESEKFVRDTLDEHRDLLRQIRKQLQMLKPELHRKVRGLLDGEDIHHDDAIEAMVDLKSGVSPDEKIYIQRLKAERDVSTLFLIDMSASTDESIESLKKDQLADSADTTPEPVGDSVTEGKTGADAIDYLMDAYDGNLKPAAPKEEVRIIDIERQAVVLMAEALEELGDSYAIGGFSGYGREQVEYFMCKDFNEHYNSEIKGRIEAISPRRSTRMGPPIRHGIAQLNKTESKVKAMIIISDGYPQDFDYGKDRKSKLYGIEDTAKALMEAKKEGIHTFCLTVDPSGHDYLKDMCPDDQYMIIQDIEDLPKELSRVYSTLTS